MSGPSNGSRARLHTFPDAREIVIAVREFLVDEVIPGAAGTLAYHARVAANLLAALERELAAPADTAERFAAGLAAFGVADERELAELLRSGAVSADTPGLLQFLAEATRERLEISNPAYLDDVPPRATDATDATDNTDNTDNTDAARPGRIARDDRAS